VKKWLFSPAIDLAVFGGTAALAMLLVLVGPHGQAPEWTWITGVLLVDVAHVWSTSFVVYLDPAEWRRRPALYAGAPILCFVAATMLYACGEGVFWRAIAYLAVFHFIRQQYGWVMLYRARNGERDRAGRIIDGAAIYATTLYPLVWWHAHLPRSFSWMKDGDFAAGLPPWVANAAGIGYVGILAAYVVRALFARSVSWGKHLVVATTAACWYVGIVVTNSDYAFTVTNVFIHGIPYLVLVYLYARAASRQPESRSGPSARLLARGVVVFLGTLWLAAYVEEMLWDRVFWHDRPWLFGGGLEAGRAAFILAPLLATPQLTHYVLDAFLWRRRSNPRLGQLL
jgi:hypothetical protein